MFSLKCSLLLLGLLTESLDHTRLMRAPTKVHPMFLSCTYRLTELHYTYGNATLSADYVGYLFFQITGLHHTNGCRTLRTPYVGEVYLENHLVTLHLLVSSLKCRLWLLGLLTELLDHTTLLGAPPTVQLMFVSSTYRLTGLHYTYESATLSAAYVGRESPGYTSVIGAPP